jgi:uncharacterized coiled-coil protein SlyX
MADDSDRTPSGIRRPQLVELRGDVRRLEQRVADQEEGLGEVRDHVSDLRETTARIDGKMQHLSSAYERAAAAVALQAAADADVKRAQALADIRERERVSKFKRTIQKEFAFKIMTVLLGLGTALAALLGHVRC